MDSDRKGKRLRNIKQLGFTDYVYPGATHTRFAHSIGVYHLACKMIQAIESEGFPKDAYKMNDEDKKCIRVAALCHDLGHGPFSHIYEHMANDILTNEERGGKYWEHERLSARLVEVMFEEKLREELTKENIHLIKDLIQGDKKNMQEKKKKYMFQIVSNADSGVDVDKWDYFNRDAMACGLLNGFQFDRFLSVARIVETEPGVFELGYRDYDALSLYNMFHTRFILHQRIRHKVIYAVDIMMRDVFRFVHEANQDSHEERNVIDVFPVKCEDDLHGNSQALMKYIRLSDDILYKIKTHSGKRYKKAKELLQTIHERKLYKLVADIPIQVSNSSDKDKLDAEYENAKERMMKLVVQAELQEPRDVEILKVSYDYGCKEKDPVSKLYFYRKGETEKGIKLPRTKVSPVLPSIFQEYHLRVYEKLSQPNEKRVEQLVKLIKSEFETTEPKCEIIGEEEIPPLQKNLDQEQRAEVE